MLRRQRPMMVVMPIRVQSMFGPLVAAYAVTVIVVDHLVATGAIPLHLLASSPAGLLHGRLWTMLTSGLVSAGNLDIVQTVALAAVLVAFAARHGGRLALGTALAAHVGSALLAYAGLLIITATGIASDHADLISPDYGTSCVWLGCVAGLLASELVPLRGRRLVAGLAVAIGILATLPWGPLAEDPLTTVEHLLAIAIGAGIAVASGRARRSDTSGAVPEHLAERHEPVSAGA